MKKFFALLLFLAVGLSGAHAGTIVYLEPAGSTYISTSYSSGGSYYYYSSWRPASYFSFSRWYEPHWSFSPVWYFPRPAYVYGHNHHLHVCNSFCPYYSTRWSGYAHGHYLHICDSRCAYYSGFSDFRSSYYYHGHPRHVCDRSCAWYVQPRLVKLYPHGHRNHVCDRSCDYYTSRSSYYYHGHAYHVCDSRCSYYVETPVFYAHGHRLHVCDSSCSYYPRPVYYAHGHLRHVCNDDCSYFGHNSRSNSFILRFDNKDAHSERDLDRFVRFEERGRPTPRTTTSNSSKRTETGNSVNSRIYDSYNRQSFIRDRESNDRGNRFTRVTERETTGRTTTGNSRQTESNNRSNQFVIQAPPYSSRNNSNSLDIRGAIRERDSNRTQGGTTGNSVDSGALRRR